MPPSGTCETLFVGAVEPDDLQVSVAAHVAHAMDVVGREAFPPARHEFSARRWAVIAAHPELQEREALKGLRLTAAMTNALMRRGVPDLAAAVTADLAALTLKIAYERWSKTHDGAEFSDVARRTLGKVHAAAALCWPGRTIRAVWLLPVAPAHGRLSRCVGIEPKVILPLVL